MLGEELAGHGPVLEGLWRAAAARRLPHALCFEGPAGIGKFLAARRLAAGLLCARGPAAPCGTCGPCRRVQARSHPDLFVHEAEGEAEITIHYVTRREQQPKEVEPLDEFLALRPAEGGWRVVLLREFERANESAQNALLKLLEEPGGSTLLALETAHSEILLPTIRSRCARIRLAPLDSRDAAAVLARSGLEAERAARLARWSAGSPGRALELARQEAEGLRAALATLLDGTLDPFAFGARVAELGGTFRGNTDSARARARAAAVIELALALLADFARHAAGRPAETLAHGDLCARHPRAGAGTVCSTSVQALLQARHDVESNLDPGGVLDRVALTLAELCAPPARPRAARS